MILQSTILTPANTTKANPKKTVLELMQGVIYKVEVFFPPGSSGLMGVRVFDSASQLYPFTSNEWFTGDNNRIEYADTYRKNNPPFVFPIHTYNLDTDYDHACIVRIGIATSGEEISSVTPITWVAKLLEAINTAMGVQKQKQETTLAQALAFLRGKRK